MTTRTIEISPAKLRIQGSDGIVLITGTDLAHEWFSDILRETSGGEPHEHRARRAIIAAAACLETHWFVWAQNRAIAVANKRGEFRSEDILHRVFPHTRRMPSLWGKFVREKVHADLYLDIDYKPMSAGSGRAKRLRTLVTYRDVLAHGKTGRFRVSTAHPSRDITPELTINDLQKIDLDWLQDVVRECIAYLYRDDPLNAPRWIKRT